MKRPGSYIRTALLAAVVASGTFHLRVQAADPKEDIIAEVMKTYHKAPKGVDPVCKKATDGKASPEEITKLLAAYKNLAKAKPSKGDEASWKEKTGKLIAATEALQKGQADGLARYKEAVNCKACHSVHKPD